MPPQAGNPQGLVHTAAFADIMYSFRWGGDFVAYFMRFRDQLRDWESIPLADPFSEGDRSALAALYPDVPWRELVPRTKP